MYNYVNYHIIYYGERGNLWHGECMRSTECLLVLFVLGLSFLLDRNCVMTSCVLFIDRYLERMFNYYS